MSMRISLRIQTTLRYSLAMGPGGSGLRWGSPAGAGGSLVEFDELALGIQLVPGVRLYAVLPDLAGADMD